MPYFSRDDIVQIGTPPGPGLVGALRLSGDNAFAILGRVAEGLDGVLAERPARSVHHGGIRLRLSRFGRRVGGKETTACPARFFLMPAPASYTREDVVEIHVAGSRVLLDAAMAALTGAGARPAAPGEFTFRAFRNGRLSLGQAEAVEEVVRAGNDAERRRALGRLGDRDTRKVSLWRDRTMDLAADLEAVLDFAGEELEEGVAAGLAAMATELEAEGGAIAGVSRAGRGEPPHVALVGLANAGKSSLFNAILGHDAVLVSPQASTTRDSLKRRVEYEGVDLILSDNPGYDPGREDAGATVSDLSQRRLGGEDLACWVVDASRQADARVEEFARRLRGRAVIVMNKSDLPRRCDRERIAALAARAGVSVVALVEASAAAGEGIAAVRHCLAEAGRGLDASSFWNRREAMELSAALAGIRGAVGELSGPGRLELAAEEVRAAAAAFGRVLGDGYAEEALGRIFSRFCIGK